jgi:hypothetical protein
MDDATKNASRVRPNPSPDSLGGTRDYAGLENGRTREASVAILEQAAFLLSLLDPEVIYPEPMAEEWPATVPGAFLVPLDIEVGDE